MCVHNYKSLSKTEINLRKGTRVFVIEKNLNGWWFVDAPAEGQGYVPKCVLKPFKSSSNHQKSIRRSAENEEENDEENHDDDPILLEKSNNPKISI